MSDSMRIGKNVQGHVQTDDGRIIKAFNDKNFVDAPNLKRALLQVDLAPMSADELQALAEQVATVDDGRDKILVMFEPELDESGALKSESVEAALLEADEIKKMRKLDVNDPIVINGRKAVIVALHDEREDHRIGELVGVTLAFFGVGAALFATGGLAGTVAAAVGAASGGIAAGATAREIKERNIPAEELLERPARGDMLDRVRGLRRGERTHHLDQMESPLLKGLKPKG